MSSVVLCNLGARDVALRPENDATGQGDFVYPKPARGTRQWLDQYTQIADRLCFPIIEPCLRYILGRCPQGVSLFVIGTDQDDEAHKGGDTLYSAELAARRLGGMLGNALTCVEPRLLRKVSPAFYDDVFDAMDRLLATVPQTDVDLCYVILCGGTPACNTALLLQGAAGRYDRRLRVVYLPQKGEPQELRAGQQVINAFAEAAARKHLERLDFADARPLLEDLGCAPGLALLAAYGEQRLAFDFPAAQATLLDALREGDQDVRTFINQHLRHDLDGLTAGGGSAPQLLALLRELYWNAAITYVHGRYADFLGRIYRFQEAVLRYLVESVFDLATDLDDPVRAQNQARWEAGIGANPGLQRFLEQQTLSEGGRSLDWTAIGRPTYKAMLSFAVQGGAGSDGSPLLSTADRKRYTALLKRVNAFDRLVELRHRTIIGHGFQGISSEIICANYSGRASDGRVMTPVEGLAEVMRMLGADVESSPYRLIADVAIDRLQHGLP